MGANVDEIRRLEDRLRLLGEATHAFAASAEDPSRLLGTIAGRVSELVGDSCSVFLLSDDGSTLRPVARRSPHAAFFHEAREVVMATPMAVAERPHIQRVLDTGEALLIPHVDLAEYGAHAAPEYAALVRVLGLHSLLVVALRLQGRPLGILALSRLRSDAPPYEESDRVLAEILADSAALAIGSSRLLVSRVEAEARFQRLADAGILGIIVSDLEGRVTEINDTLLDTLGYERDEIVSGEVAWAQVTPPGWEEVDALAKDQLRREGVAQLREKEYLRKNGARVPVLIGSAALPASTAQVISFVLDVSERKAARAAVEELRAQLALDALFHDLLEAAPDAIVILDSAGRIVLVNAETETLFGYAREELVGKPIEALVPAGAPDRSGKDNAAFFAAPRGRAAGPGAELCGIRKDGTSIPIEINVSPLDTNRGPLITAAIRDITERKKAEDQRAHLAALVEASDDAIIGKTLDGTITSWNDGARRVFGYEAAEIVGKSITLLVPAGREDEERHVLERLATGERVHFDTVRRRKDGREIDVSVTSCPVRDARGALIGVSKVARDITARHEAEVALARAKEAAEAANRELEAFSYSVAHDLRAPLRGMSGFAHVLLESYKDKLDADGVDALEEVMRNAKKMAALIDALLGLARLSRSEPHREIVDLSVLARMTLAQLQANEPERKVDLAVADDLRAEVDPTLTRALLENLLANAWKFTSKAPAPRIEVGATVIEGARSFFVRDNGAGFDMAFAKKLFAPFQRLHTADEFPGTGIGLATVQRIVSRHGGRVWAEGAVGRGATFYFSLPTSTRGAAA